MSDPVFATYVFAALLTVACLFSLRARRDTGVSVGVVQELKGFAILAVVFSHVGYFLAQDHRFLFPLSTLAGVGVDIFLLVSGFGLAASALKNPRSPMEFYIRRLDKLFVPLWITLAAFFSLDFFLGGTTYPLSYVLQSFLGWFPSADVMTDVNSPLWYITIIVFFYLVFPFLFFKRRPLLSSVALLAAGYAAHQVTLPFLPHVEHLHELHLWAFPVGVFAAGLLQGRALPRIKNPFVEFGILGALAAIVGYMAVYGYVGAGVFAEQTSSVVLALLVSAFFALKRFEVRLLYLFGLFSYEIYLFHWPLMSRYDLLFASLPPWLALALYLCLFLVIGWVFQFLLKRVSHAGRKAPGNP